MPTNRHIRLDLGSDGIATITLDTADSPINLLSGDVVDELVHTFQRLHAMKELTGLILRSGKKNHFSDGMPLAEILGVEDFSRAMEKYQTGAELMDLVTTLKFPSVAVIDGICRSGGLELALCCTYRVAGDGPHVSFSLPDIGVGLLPGWGGTQRLPRLIGLFPAADLIESGRTLATKEAFRLGLIDDHTASEILEDLARGWLAESPSVHHPSRIAAGAKLKEYVPIVRNFLLRRQRRKIAFKTGGVHPAPLALLDLFVETYHSDNPFRFELESKKAGELASTPVAKSLIRVALAAQQIAKTRFETPAARVEKVAIVGAGHRGSDIAHLFALSGRQVRLRDTSTASLARAIVRMRGRNGTDATTLRRIAPTTDWTGFRQAGFALERVIENSEIKKETLAEIARHVSPDAVIASTTSTLSIVELSETIPHPERFIGLHFFHPARENTLVEVIPIAATSDRTIATVFAMASDLGKTPVLVSDFPGFLVNRVLGVFFIEALRAAEEGTSISEIENAMRAFGCEKGPFEMMDELGLDFVEEILTLLSRSFPHIPLAGALVGAIRTQGRLGKKNGLGFYRYSGGRKKLDESVFPHPSPTSSQISNESMYAELVDRLILVMVNEATRCLEEKVVFSVQDLNLAMVLGAGFPRFRGGPLTYAGAQGLRQISDRLSAMAEKHGPHFKPAKHLLELAQIDGTFQ